MANDKTVKSLKVLLADTYALYLKSQNYHWNITGENFYSLHKMLEEHYRALAEAIDTIAERIRTLGSKTPASFDAFSALTMIKNGNEKYDWKKMIKDLHSDHKMVSLSIKKALAVAQEEGDDATFDMLVERIEYHQKITWMLETML